MKAEQFERGLLKPQPIRALGRVARGTSLKLHAHVCTWSKDCKNFWTFRYGSFGC